MPPFKAPDNNPEKLTHDQMLQLVHEYLAHAFNGHNLITPEQHRAMLDRVFPPFNTTYLDGANFIPPSGKFVNLRGEPVEKP